MSAFVSRMNILLFKLLVVLLKTEKYISFTTYFVFKGLKRYGGALMKQIAVLDKLKLVKDIEDRIIRFTKITDRVVARNIARKWVFDRLNMG